MTLRGILTLSVLLGTLASPPAVHACTCVTGAPICETFWNTPVVFAGEVLTVASVPSPSGFMASRVVTFRVERPWRGEVAGQVDVHTGSGGGDCGYGFIVGERYLVYASFYNDRLSTSICSRTRLLAEAQEDLDYLNVAFRPATGGRLFGHVEYQRQAPDLPPQPIAGYTVTASDGQREWSTKTGADGRYEFTGMPAGKYTVKVQVPDAEHAYGSPEAELADPRGCAARDFHVAPNGRISIRVLDDAGQPVRGALIEVIALESLREGTRYPAVRFAEAGADGTAEAGQLAAGRYVVGINIVQPPTPENPHAPLFYPGAARVADALVIDLARGERVSPDPFVLPPAPQAVTIAGVVLWRDGRPASGAVVGLGTGAPPADRQVGLVVKTDVAGRFTLKALAGQRYYVRASIASETDGSRWHARTQELEIAPGMSPLTLTLEPPRR